MAIILGGKVPIGAVEGIIGIEAKSPGTFHLEKSLPPYGREDHVSKTREPNAF
jgi:hypothetical protein